jgi:hypothetical protein
LPVCDTLQACYLVNLKTRAEFILTGIDSYVLDSGNDRGYSIRCDVSGTQGAESDFIKFAYDTVVHDEFGLPRFMGGDSNAGEWVNPVPYLGTCGSKTVRIEGHVWSNMCFSKQYIINVEKADGSCNPVNPFNAPVTQPTQAPIRTPTKAPVKSPTKVPTKAPVPTSAVTVPVAAPAPTAPSGPITELWLMYTGVDPSVRVLKLSSNAVNVVDLQLLSLPSAQFSIDALVASNVKSVIFSNGRVETAFPLAYCGNNGNNFYACPDLALGANVTITVTAYAKAYGIGQVLASRSTTVQIIQTPPPVAPSPPVAPPVLAPVVPPVPGCPLPKVRFHLIFSHTVNPLSKYLSHFTFYLLLSF